jgi:hypothetical protein
MDGSRLRSPPGTVSNKTLFLTFLHVRRVIFLYKEMAAVLRLNFGCALPTRILLLSLGFPGGDDDQNTYVVGELRH